MKKYNGLMTIFTITVISIVIEYGDSSIRVLGIRLTHRIPIRDISLKEFHSFFTLVFFMLATFLIKKVMVREDPGNKVEFHANSLSHEPRFLIA